MNHAAKVHILDTYKQTYTLLFFLGQSGESSLLLGCGRIRGDSLVKTNFAESIFYTLAYNALLILYMGRKQQYPVCKSVGQSKWQIHFKM